MGPCVQNSCSPQEINFFFFLLREVENYFKREREVASPKNSHMQKFIFHPHVFCLRSNIFKVLSKNAKLESSREGREGQRNLCQEICDTVAFCEWEASNNIKGGTVGEGQHNRGSLLQNQTTSPTQRRRQSSAMPSSSALLCCLVFLAGVAASRDASAPSDSSCTHLPASLPHMLRELRAAFGRVKTFFVSIKPSCPSFLPPLGLQEEPFCRSSQEPPFHPPPPSASIPPEAEILRSPWSNCGFSELI